MRPIKISRCFTYNMGTLLSKIRYLDLDLSRCIRHIAHAMQYTAPDLAICFRSNTQLMTGILALDYGNRLVHRCCTYKSV